MNCIIIEDQPPAQRILKKYIEDMGDLELKATFADAVQAMEYLKTGSVDLIFLDIHLPKISGIDLLKNMPRLPPVILTTAYSEYALESYEFDVVDYLLKPFSFQRFVKAVSRVPVKNFMHTQLDATGGPVHSRNEIFIKSGYEYIRITVDDIIYIKSDADYSEIFLPDKKCLSSDPLRKWLEVLNDQQFVRVHKSYIVNASRIIKVMGNQLYMNNKAVVPIGRAFKDDFTERFLN
ncbi:DNA-binding LytR/AlgR family response regulator [Catalinimonas alkaloidigena]|uniref:LytR/AlgR family response regulator transcription factor n=1 Tax=Catalinimonas alkaloidigena TaxID=1075417 RepID=UPI0024076B63|nr:LytTR family DNA-binding domain-containing protein [Catalinimonas alkaloidigena]MDF9797953.1 DNA-binding LytR/AlgR family response regulator [Catalinimonas alkaloidigena]